MRSAHRFHRAALLFALLAGHACAAPPRASEGAKHSPGWKRVDQLVGEQKLEAAAAETQKILDGARARKDEPEWTAALVKLTQLREALGGVETAVRLLREQPWPEGAEARTTLDLFYAQALVHYLGRYSWEIGRRERVESKGPIDLKAWTKDQIVAEALRSYSDLWSRRAALGKRPVAALAEYIQPNDYPPGIRGTLRDAVTYLAVELLADSSLWSPEQSNDLFRLDFAALVAGDPKASAAVKLDDPAVHPLVKVGALLDDLEAWHADAGRREAALEARLERIRVLHGAFTDERQRAALRADLERRLAAFPKLPWRTMGESLLVELVRDDGDLPRAHALAESCAREAPDSLGSRRCLHVQKAIEAPDFSMSAMSSDGAGRRSIEITHRNLPSLSFRAWPVDLVARIEGAHDWNLLPSGDEVRKLLARPAGAEWTVALPATPDFASHRTFVTPPMTKRGLWVVAASARPDFSPRGNRVRAVDFVLTDLVVTSRPDGAGGIDATVLDGDSGRPIAGAEVRLYRMDWRAGHSRAATHTSDAHGEVHFAPTGGEGHPSFLLAKRGDDAALDGQARYLYQPAKPSETDAALVYTDRAIYRPQQRLAWKVIAYHGSADRTSYRTVENAAVEVALVDANGQEVDKRTVTTNRFGSAAGEFAIPAGRLLGQWTVRTNRNGSASVRVEEYKRPTFEVTLRDPPAPLALNRPAKLVGEARYYFGLPVTSGKVRWRVTRAPVYPWWWGYWGRGGGAQAQTIAAGTATPGAEGTFPIAFTPEVAVGPWSSPPSRAWASTPAPGSKDRAVTYRYSVEADLTDEGGETRSASRTFRLGFVSVEATIEADFGFVRAGQPASLDVKRTDLDGAPRAGTGSFRIVALEQPAQTVPPADLPLPADDKPGAFHTPGDALRPRWDTSIDPSALMAQWKDGAVVGSGELAHDASGGARIALPALPPGAYRVRYSTTDDAGAPFDTWHDVIVAADGAAPLHLPALLLFEHATVEPGGTARLLVSSGLAGETLLLDRFRDGRAVERRRLPSDKAQVIELPIGEGERGGFGLGLAALRDHQLLQRSASLFVPWSDKQLTVELSTFRDRLTPGGKETFRVSVKRPKGAKGGAEDAAAEVLATMYDRSLDALAPYSAPSPLSLYPSRAATAVLQSSLGSQGAQWVLEEDFAPLPPDPSPRPDRLTFIDDWGIGGMGRGGGSGGHLRLLSRPMKSAPAEADMPAGAPAAPGAQPAEAESRARVATADPSAGEGKSNAPRSAPAPAAEAPLRANFAETAFFRPQLLTDGKGEAAIEFTVPDSVTSWSVWAHAITRDFASGSVHKETRSVKDLMVRPYLPRFFREGDKADLKVVVNNAGAGGLSGTVEMDIVDPVTRKSVASEFGLGARASRPFTVAPGAGADVTFPVTAPKRPGLVAFEVRAHAGSLSDGELRPLPVLPGRLHLAQSRFVALRDAGKRTMTFPDLARGDDPTLTTDQLVVTLDAQLFYTVLQAIPYLVDYPYECTEQILNRFLSTGIVSSVFDRYPAVAKMARTFAARDTRLAPFDENDPNRRMALEESPWLVEARGGATPESGLIKVLDPQIARAQRDASLQKLAKTQTANGAFPWFPGGPPSPWMTLYLMTGFARAAEFHVDVPKSMVQRGWQYLASHYHEEYEKHLDDGRYGIEFLTFLNYVASSYPDASWTQDALTPDERKRILEHGFSHWREHSPRLKAMLALTLQRMGRPKDAQLVFASVMDSAKTSPDQGTYWAPEDRAWLWYNDTIESHAFALRTLMEIDPQNPKKDGLVLWLLLNKKLNQWKSTRATAEVIYSLVHYLDQEKALAIPESTTVAIGTLKTTFDFPPDEYRGKAQLVIPGERVDPKTSSTITVEKPTKGVMFASATWHFSTDKMPAEERGDFFQLSRRYFKRESTPQGWKLTPLAEGAVISPGDEVEVQLSLRSKHEAEYVHLRDPRAAGLEPENAVSQFKWDLGLGYYEETRDSGANFFFEHLPVGEYTFEYRVRANLSGTFRVGPATVQSMYAPEFNAYSAGDVLTIE